MWAVLSVALLASACNPGDPEGEGTIAIDDPAQLEDTDQETGTNTGLGTRSNPVPVGQSVQVGPNWQVALQSATPDAGPQVESENPLNDPPATGRQFVMGMFSVSYVGDDSGTPWVELSVNFNGSAGNTFGTGSDDYCGVIPDALSDAGEMFPGAAAQGNVCISVPSEQVDGGLFMVEESFSFEPTRVFFNIQ